MNPTLRRLLMTAILASIPVQAEDWAQWRGPERTGHVAAGVMVPQTLPASPVVVWHIPIGDGVASPVISGGKVVYLDHQSGKEVVHAVNAADGKSLWSTPLDDVQKDSQSAPGPRCTPLVDGDRVYAQSCRGELMCLALADGQLIWQTQFVKDFAAVFTGEKGKAEGASRHGNTGSPLIDGDHLIAEVGGQPDASVVCFDKKTGKVIWKSQGDIPGYAAPIIATLAGSRQFIGFMADGVLGLDPVDGKFLWRAPVKTSLARHVTTPVVVGDTVMVASHTAGLLGIKIEHSGDAYSAKIAWTTKDAAINFSSPVTVGQYLYGLGPNKNFECIDVHTGAVAWSKTGFLSGNAGKSHVGIVVMGQNLLVLTDDGQLSLIAADPKEFHEVSHARVCTNNWCNPAYADGRLYLRDAKELICVQLVQ